MLKNILYINMPYNMDFLVLKKKNFNFVQIFFFGNCETFKYILNLEKNQFHINKDTNTLIIKHDKYNINISFDMNLFLKKMLNFNLTFFLKIKFKGKGYKIKFYKKNKIMFFFFGRSHLSLIKFKKINIKKQGKYKFLLSGYDLQKLKQFSKIIKMIRKINVFTLRGLRLSKQIIYKRRGKKSSYS